MRILSIECLEKRTLLSAGIVLHINPGAAGVSFGGATRDGNTLYFAAEDGVNGVELWKTDGTAGGTMMVKNIHPAGSSIPREFYQWGNIVYFTADDGVNGREVWKTDGTPGGTVMLKNIHPSGSAVPQAAWFAQAGGLLYFAADNGVNGTELWKTDGSEANTQMVADIHPTAGSSPEYLTALNGQVIFSASDGATGREPWKSDGSSGGTALIRDINTTVFSGGTLSSTPNTSSLRLVEYAGKLYFRANNLTNGIELWSTDGTFDGTTLVADINPTGSSGIGDIVVFNNKLIFAAESTSGNNELWESSGSGATLLKEIYGGSSGSYPAGFAEYNGSLVFSAEGFTLGREVWKTDGTIANTVLLKDVRPSTFSSAPSGFTVFNGALYFRADTNASNDSEVWQSDGTTAGTFLSKAINSSNTGSSPLLMGGFIGSLLLFANDGANGQELWKITPPDVTAGVFEFQTSPNAVALTYSEPMTIPTTPASYTVENLTAPGSFSPASVTYTAGTQTARFFMPAGLADGNYRFRVPASVVQDSAGAIHPSLSYSFDFFVLGADANRDRIVDTRDFNLLAGSFGQSGRVFSEGNFDYDPAGTVDSVDFNVLSDQYGRRLPLPAPATAAEPLFAQRNDGSDEERHSLLD